MVTPILRLAGATLKPDYRVLSFRYTNIDQEGINKVTIIHSLVGRL